MFSVYRCLTTLDFSVEIKFFLKKLWLDLSDIAYTLQGENY